MSFRFEDILAWKKGYQFVLCVYKVTRTFPETEKFGLTSQFRRAAVSIISNIAEGYRKISKQDKLRFMNIAQGSLEECRCYIYLSRDLGYVDNECFEYLYTNIEETSKLLNGYCKGIIGNNHLMEDDKVLS